MKNRIIQYFRKDGSIINKKDEAEHVMRCCKLHGCKYGTDEICPVVQKQKLQTYTCESCKDGDNGLLRFEDN